MDIYVNGRSSVVDSHISGASYYRRGALVSENLVYYVPTTDCSMLHFYLRRELFRFHTKKNAPRLGGIIRVSVGSDDLLLPASLSFADRVIRCV